MFGSIILDVAVGLIFTFLVLSLVTSAAVEMVASALAWRANTLLQGVKELLNDDSFTGLVKQIYNHAAVNPRTNDTAESEEKLGPKPSYIDPMQFASALTDVLQLVPGTDVTVPDLQNRVNAALPGANNRGEPPLFAVLQRNFGRCRSKIGRRAPSPNPCAIVVNFAPRPTSLQCTGCAPRTDGSEREPMKAAGRAEQPSRCQRAAYAC